MVSKHRSVVNHKSPGLCLFCGTAPVSNLRSSEFSVTRSSWRSPQSGVAFDHTMHSPLGMHASWSASHNRFNPHRPVICVFLLVYCTFFSLCHRRTKRDDKTNNEHPSFFSQLGMVNFFLFFIM